MKINSIKSAVRIQSEILIVWDDFLDGLRSKMDVHSSDVIDDETILYSPYNTTMVYKVMIVRRKNLILHVEDYAHNFQYNIEFFKYGNEVKFIFVGCQEHFMTGTMLDIFTGLIWNRRALRESIEFVEYD